MRRVCISGKRPLGSIALLGVLLPVAALSLGLLSAAGARGDAPGHLLDPGLRILLERAEEGAPLPSASFAGDPGPQIALVLEGEVDRAGLERLGGRVQTVAGPVTTVRAPLDRVPGLLHVAGLRRLAAASALDPMLDVSVDSIAAPLAWQGMIPPQNLPLRGEGVIVGIVDSGIDLAHPDFQTAAGSTRILFLWDQTVGTAHPSGFSYGEEYTAALIDAGQASECRDTQGHGTQMAGIAAGNGRATGNDQPASQYVGVAPEAHLIVVKSGLTDAEVIDGVSYIFQKADALGLPAVVNLSVGTHKGGHDGSAALDLALSALAGPGRILTAAAGNFGDLPVHGRADLAPGETREVPFTIPAYTADNIFFDESLFLEGWHDADASFRVRLRSPNGLATAWIDPGQSSGTVVTADAKVLIDNGTYTSSKGSRLIGIAFWRGTTVDPAPVPGTWIIELSRRAGTASGAVDFWLTRWTLGTTTWPGFADPDPACTIASPATADGVLSTGAYVTKRRWTNLDGGQSSYGFQILGSIAYFSSLGPRRDGVPRPDVVAPGFGVASSLSADCPHSAWSQVQDGVHSVGSGTSQANAHTTGAIALILQELLAGGEGPPAPARIRSVLLERAHHDSFTGAAYDPAYGNGKLSLLPKGSTAVIDEGPADPFVPTPARFSLAPPFPNPAAGTMILEYTLSDGPGTAMGASGGTATLGGTTVVLVIVDLQGRLVARFERPAEAGRQRLFWDGNGSDGRPVPAGLYYARLTAGPDTAVRKLVRLAR